MGRKLVRGVDQLRPAARPPRISANRPSSHKHIEELVRMPFTGFWDRWRRRQLQQQHHGSSPNLRETEKQREAAARQAAEQLARAMASEPPCPPQNHDSSSCVTEHHHSDEGSTSRPRPDGDTGRAAHQNPPQQDRPGRAGG
jgi:hypothetical protein